MNELIKLGRDVIDRDYYILDLMHIDWNLKIILGHVTKPPVVIDFKLECIDYRFSKELFRINHLSKISCKDDAFWPVLLIEDSSYLKKINDEESDLLLTVFEDLKHYLVFDGDYLVDVIAGKDPEIYFDKDNSKKHL